MIILVFFWCCIVRDVVDVPRSCATNLGGARVDSELVGVEGAPHPHATALPWQFQRPELALRDAMP